MPLILREACLVRRPEILHWLCLYTEPLGALPSCCPLCGCSGCWVLPWKWVSSFLLSLSLPQADGVLGPGSTCCLSVVLPRQFGAFSWVLKVLGPPDHLLVFTWVRIKVVTVDLSVTTDSSAFSCLTAANSTKLQISFFPFSPLSFEFFALEEKCWSSKSTAWLTLCAQLLALALLKLSLL